MWSHASDAGTLRGIISTNNRRTNMVKFINKLTGGEMWVADDKVEEYKAAGHRPAAKSMPKKPAKPAEKKPKAKKK